MSKYARDEFDRIPEYTDRTGVHRLTPGKVASDRGLGLLMGVGALALLVGLVSYFILPSFLGSPPEGGARAAASTPSSAPASSSSEEPASSPKPSDEAEPPASPKPSKSAKPTPSPSEEPLPAAAEPTSGGPSEAVSYAATVNVYNGANRDGLAATGAQMLRAGGFSQVKAANWTKTVDGSTVYYMSDASQATAQEAARVLGISSVVQTSNIPSEISVVLGRSFG